MNEIAAHVKAVLDEASRFNSEHTYSISRIVVDAEFVTAKRTGSDNLLIVSKRRPGGLEWGN